MNINWSTEKRKISDLIPANYNPRKWPENEKNNLAKSIDKFSLADPLVINQDNKIIGGHFRLNILKSKGIVEVDCRVPNRLLTEDEEKELNIRLNRNLGLWDFEALANFDEELLKDIGFDSKELDKIFKIDDTDKDDDVPEERYVTDIKNGDIYQLGRHRLMCGDSTKKDDVEKIMQGERCVLSLTDPPYSVNYKSRKNKTNETLDSYEDPANAKDLLLGFMSCMPTDVVVMTYADKQLHPYVLVCESLGMETIDLLVWVKQNFCFWPGGRYQQKHELIFIARKKGVNIVDNCESNQSTVFEIDRQMKNDIHPTQRPLELFEILLKNHSNRDDLVWEPFGGSGTTLIACEKNNRICRAIEISPLFCQVIIDRWEKFTNGKAEKIHG